MASTLGIHEHMEVVGSDGQHIGTVETVEGRWIKLASNDPLARGMSCHTELSQVAFVDERVHLTLPALQVLGTAGGVLTS